MVLAHVEARIILSLRWPIQRMMRFVPGNRSRHNFSTDSKLEAATRHGQMAPTSAQHGDVDYLMVAVMTGADGGDGQQAVVRPDGELCLSHWYGRSLPALTFSVTWLRGVSGLGSQRSQQHSRARGTKS